MSDAKQKLLEKYGLAPASDAPAPDGSAKARLLEKYREPGMGEAVARGAGAFGLEAGRGLVGTAGMAAQGEQALFESMDTIRGDVLDWFGVSKAAKDRLGAMAQAGTFVARKLADAAAWAGEGIQGASEAIPRDERYSDRLIGQVGSGVGQSIGYLGVTAATGGIGGAGMAVSSSVEAMQQRAEQLGASETQRAWMALGGVPIGLVEMAGLERVAPAFGRVMKAKFGQKAVDDIAEHMTEHWIRKTAIQGATEAGEEVVQSGIQWGLEKYTGANPEAALEVFESLKQEGVPAFIAATLLGGPMNKIMANSRGQVLTDAGMAEVKKQAEAMDAERQKLAAEPVNVEAEQKRTSRLSASVLAKTNTPVRILDRLDEKSAGWKVLGNRLGVDVVVGEWDDTSAPAVHLDGVVLVNAKAGDDRVVRSLVFHEAAHAMLRARGEQGARKGKELLQAFEALMPGFLEQSETIYRKMAEDRGEAQPGDELSVDGTPFEEEGFAHSIERMAALVDVAMSPQGQRALTELLRKDRTAGEWLLDGIKSIANGIPGVRLEKSLQARLRMADELMAREVGGDSKGMKGTDAIQLALLLAETFDQLGPMVQKATAAPKAADAAPTPAEGASNAPGSASEAAQPASSAEKVFGFDPATGQGVGVREGQPVSAADTLEVAPESDDEFLKLARERFRDVQTVGIALVQRKFGVGFARAKTIRDRLMAERASPGSGRAVGRAAELELPDGSSKPVAYEIVELYTIKPSHDPLAGFKQRLGGDKNERPYHDPVEGKDLRDRVTRNAEDLKPGFLVTDTPAATDGPPIVNEKGQVLGGNARTMVMELVYMRGGEQAARLRAALEDSAEAFGIDRAAVAAMKQPVLVRRMADKDAGAEGELSRILNDPFTAPRTFAADAVSRGSKIDEQAARAIAEAIGDGTLAEALANKGTRLDILQALVTAGAMSDADVEKMNRGQDDTLTEGTKETIAATLLGAVVSDVRVLSSMAPGVRQSVMKALPYLVRAKTVWPRFGAILEHAIEALTESRAAGLPLAEIAKQTTVEDQAWRHDERAFALAERLLSDTQKEFARRMATLAEALYDAAQGQGSLFGGGRAVRSAPQEFDAQVGSDGGGVRSGDGDAAAGGQAQFALADRNQLGLYSKLERVLRDEIRQDKFTGEQLLAMLKTKGVGADELKWYRLAEYVEATKRPSYTKAEIADWIERVRPKITETVLTKDAKLRNESLTRAARSAYHDTFAPIERDDGDFTFVDNGETMTFEGDPSTWDDAKLAMWNDLKFATSTQAMLRENLFGENSTVDDAEQILKEFRVTPMSIELDPEKLAFLNENGQTFQSDRVEAWHAVVPGVQDFYLIRRRVERFPWLTQDRTEAEREVAYGSQIDTSYEIAERERFRKFVDNYKARNVGMASVSLLRDGEPAAKGVEYANYTTHGDQSGTDSYAEVLVNVESAAGLNPTDATGGAVTPKPSRSFRVTKHFPGTANANRLVHYRADVFPMGVDGTRVVAGVIEEVQSDYHQQSREKRHEIVKDTMSRLDITEAEAEKLVPVDAAYVEPPNADEIRAAHEALRVAMNEQVRAREQYENLEAVSDTARRVLRVGANSGNEATFLEVFRNNGLAMELARAIDFMADRNRTDGFTTPELAREMMDGRPVEYLHGNVSADPREIAAGLIEEAELRSNAVLAGTIERSDARARASAEIDRLDPGMIETNPKLVDQPWRKTQQYSALALKLATTRFAKNPDIEAIAWPAGVEHVKRYSDAMRQVAKRVEWEIMHRDLDDGAPLHEKPDQSRLPLRLIRGDSDGSWFVEDAAGKRLRWFKGKRAAERHVEHLTTPVVSLTTDYGRGSVGHFPLNGKINTDDNTIEDALGTAMANDIRAAVASGKTDGAFEGDEIRIGTKGMEGAYDKIMPSAAKDVGKRYGAVPEFKKVTVNGKPMDFWVMPITPELRRAALDDGLPQFALRPEDMENMGRAARKAEKEGERTGVGSSPSRLANESDIPAYRAVQRGVREVWSEGFEPVTRAEQQAKAEARLAADFAGERKRLMEKVDRGELPTPDEQIELKLMATQLVSDFLAGNSTDAADFQTAAEANEAAELLYTYFEARSGAGRALGVIRDAFRSNRTGKQHLADLVLTLSPDLRRRIQAERAKISSIAATAIVKQQAKDEIKRLYRLEAERVRKAQDALREAGFNPQWIASSYFNDPATFGRIARIVASEKAGPWDWLIELRYANMLSAPMTHAYNVTGNALNTLVNQHLQRNAAALMNLAGQSPDAPTFGEQQAFYASWLGAAMQAGRNFALSWKTELPIFEFEMQRNGYVIPGGWGTKIDAMGDAVLPGEFGRILRAPSLRLLTAADEFFKTLAAVTEGHALAWRQATNEGFRGANRDARIDALLHGPTNEIHERSLVTAKRLAFQGERGPISRGVLAVRGAVNSAMPGEFPLGSILLPFVGTPTAIFEEAIGLPFHPVKTTYKAIAAALGKPYEGGRGQAVEDAARSAIAIGFVLAALAMVYDDDEETGLPRITGSAPRDSGDRELAYRTAPPMSVRIGDTYHSYGQLEPIGTMLGLLVDSANAFRKEGTAAAFGAFVRAIPAIASDKTYLETVGEIYKIAQAQGDIGDKIARMSTRTFVTPMIPNIIRSAARSTDDVARANTVRKYDDAGLWESAARSIPYQALPVEAIAPPPKYDLWGRPMEKQAGWFSRLVNPAAATQNLSNVLDVDLLLRNYQARFERGEIKDNGAREITPTSPDYSFTYKGERHYMTDEEYERLQRDAGTMARRALSGSFSRSQVERPEWEDVREIADEIRSARETVRNRIINDRRRKGDL